MTEYGKRFSGIVSSLLKEIDGEYESINKAATLMSQAIARDQLIHVIGTGGAYEHRSLRALHARRESGARQWYS